MARYPLNQPIRLSTTTKQINIDGTYSLANATAITLTIAKPDGTQQTYSSPTNDGTGLYHQDIPAADLQQLGHYQYAWTSTGIAAGVVPGDFDVYDPYEVAILPLQDAKDHLNIPQATTTWDSKILNWLASIQSSLERRTGGPIITRSITERVEAVSGMTRLCLRQRPVVAVTAITSESSGGSLSLADIKVDANSGVIQRSLGMPLYGPYFAWQPWFLVTYTAGWGTSVPGAFSDFARIVVAHLWETRRGAVALPMTSEEAVIVPGFAFAIPAAAADILNGSVNGLPLVSEAYV